MLLVRLAKALLKEGLALSNSLLPCNSLVKGRYAIEKKMFYSTTYAYGKNEFTITIFDVQVVSCKLSVHAATVFLDWKKRQ